MFFADDSMASKFNQHSQSNMVVFEAELAEENVHMLFENGLGYLRTCHLVTANLDLESLNASNYSHVQCSKCHAVELFVYYGSGYRFD